MEPTLMKRYVVSRGHEDSAMSLIHWFLEGADGIEIVEKINKDRTIVDMTDEAVTWIHKYFPAFTVKELLPH